MCVRLVILCVLISILGCAGQNPSEYQAQLADLISPGDSFVGAIQRLTMSGFTCDDRSIQPTITCTRMRPASFLSNCVFRIDFIADTSRGRVATVMLKRFSCATL
jgi:hypothetical protein